MIHYYDAFVVGLALGVTVTRFLLRKMYATTREWRRAAQQHAEVAQQWSEVAARRHEAASDAERKVREGLARLEEWTQ